MPQNLTTSEKKVLIALARKDRFSPDELTSESELSIEAAMQ